MLIYAKTFSKQTFKGITLYCLLNLFPGYRKSQSGGFTFSFPDQNRNTGIPVSNIIFKNLLEIDGAGKSQ